MVANNDAADQIVRYTMEGTEIILKLTGVAAKNAALFLLAALKDQKKTRGRTTVTRMLREGKPLKFFPVPTDQLKQFAKEARKYGLLFVAMKHRGNNETETDIMVFAQDAPKVNRIMDRLKLACVDRDVVEAEILNGGGKGMPENFSWLERNYPSGNFSRSSSDSTPELPDAGGIKLIGLPAPEQSVIIAEAPQEMLALPERRPRRETPHPSGTTDVDVGDKSRLRTLAPQGVADNVIIQPSPRGVLMLPAPDDGRRSIRKELQEIRELQKNAPLGAVRGSRQKSPQKRMKRPKAKVR